MSRVKIPLTEFLADRLLILAKSEDVFPAPFATVGEWFFGEPNGRGRSFPTRKAAEAFACEMFQAAVGQSGQGHLFEVAP